MNRQPGSVKPLRNAWESAWATGWLAAKQNRVPAFVMWLFGTAVVVGYFHCDPVHEFLNWVGRIKTGFGWKFSLVSTAIVGGLIPATVSNWMRRGASGAAASHTTQSRFGFVLSSTLLWGYKGVEIDFFYRFQAWLFGSTADWPTIFYKTICDQIIMVPLFGLVNVVLFYHWRENGYSFKASRAALGEGWYQKRVLPVLIANWLIWIPAVAMIYCLPDALQLPSQNLILCFWVLILLFFTHEKASG